MLKWGVEGVQNDRCSKGVMPIKWSEDGRIAMRWEADNDGRECGLNGSTIRAMLPSEILKGKSVICYEADHEGVRNDSPTKTE